MSNTHRPQIVKDFLLYLVHELHFTPYTAKCYGGDLDHSIQYLVAMIGADTDETRVKNRILEVDSSRIKQFLEFLANSNYAKTTIARKLAALRSFYKYCVRCNYATSSPCENVHSPKFERPAPRIIGSAEIGRLLGAPDSRKLLGLRDRAMLKLTCAIGLRISELVALNIGDVLQATMEVRVKGRKRTRALKIEQGTLDVILAYLNKRTQGQEVSAIPKEDPLFLNKHGKRISSRSFRRKFDTYLAKCRLDSSLSPKTLRAAYAAEKLGKGVSPLSVQELMGHSKLPSTLRYMRPALVAV